MRKFTKLSIIVSHEGNEENGYAAPTVEMMSGNNSVQVSDFESALAMLPPGSEVCVVAKGTVGNKSVHNLSRIIREGCILVSLDLSAVHEFSRVIDSPFRANKNLSAIVFPGNLVAINSLAFEDCTNLESVVIPATVKKIGALAFSGCEKLTNMEFSDANGWFAARESGEKEPVNNLHKSDDNPFRFTLPSSPYRTCELVKEE